MLIGSAGLFFEGFSVSSVALLDSAGDPDPAGVLPGVQSAGWEPEVETFDEFSNDILIGVWHDVRRVSFSVEAGFVSLGAWGRITGSPVEQSSLPGEFGYMATVPLYERGASNGATIPVRVTIPAKDSEGVVHEALVTMFAVKFQPPRLSGASYKSGLTVAYEGTVLLSDTDERGQALTRPAFGRLEALSLAAEYDAGIYDSEAFYDGK